ncbi:bifunctional nuclease family protein [Desulfovibrio sp. SGI.169]|uniref:bifunctional nuclease family protein n=1 Tax=Desulfovibrio sp. SGI.169 TaxID=3420561 RepID=UPI003CFEC934
MVEMHVFGLSIDPQTKNPIVILKQIDGEAVLPIWVGAMEAMAISLVLNNERLPRPLTHDLLLMSLNALKAELLHVEITELKDGIYYALLALRGPEGQARVDCRPSDAIALALRAGASILVSPSALQRPRGETPSAQAADAATDMMRKVSARKEVDLLNGLLSRDGILPNEDRPDEEEHYRNLLRSLDPISRHKM